MIADYHCGVAGGSRDSDKNLGQRGRLDLFEAPILAGRNLVLIIQFQRELDLSRVVRSVTSGADFSEGVTRKVGRSGDGNNAVAAESRRIKIRVIKNVEELRAKLQAYAFVERKVLEDGEIQPVESRSRYLGRRASQRAKATIRRHTAHQGTSRGLAESRSVSNPTQLAIRVGVQSKFRALSANKEIIASRSFASS